MNDGAFLHHEYARAELERGLDVLLDQQDRYAALVDAVNFTADLRNQTRHDAFGRFIKNDELWPHHQAAGNREHLLFAARQCPARLLQPLPEAGKAGEHIVFARDVTLSGQADIEIFDDR